jgi:hypothetical protein
MATATGKSHTMSTRAHLHSFIGGVGVVSVFAILGGAIAMAAGIWGGVAGATMLGLPILLGGLAGKFVQHTTSCVAPKPKQGERLRTLTFLLGAGLTTWGLVAYCAPTPHAAHNRHALVAEMKPLAGKFERAAREVNKHIIWPTIAHASHHRPPAPNP